MEARKESGSFRSGEMSLTRKARAGDQEIESPRGGGNLPRKSPTGTLTAPPYGRDNGLGRRGPNARRGPLLAKPHVASPHLNNTPGMGKSGKARMRRATSCSSGSAIAETARAHRREEGLGDCAPARDPAARESWDVCRAGTLDAALGAGPAAPYRKSRISLNFRYYDFETPAYFLYPEQTRPFLRDVREGPRCQLRSMEYGVYAPLPGRAFREILAWFWPPDLAASAGNPRGNFSKQISFKKKKKAKMPVTLF